MSHKTLDFNIIVAQNERESVNVFVEKLRHRWNSYKKKFVNVHREVFHPLTLIYSYGEVIKIKNSQSRDSENANLDQMDLKSIAVLSHNICDKS